MGEINPFLLGGISFLIASIPTLLATLYFYITTRKFNKYGTVTYGEIDKITEGFRTPYRKDAAQEDDYLWLKFNINGKEEFDYTHIPIFSQKERDKRFPIGSKKKIKVLKHKNGKYEIRLLKEDKENASYWKTLTMAVITILVLLVSVYFFYQN